MLRERVERIQNLTQETIFIDLFFEDEDTRIFARRLACHGLIYPTSSLFVLLPIWPSTQKNDASFCYSLRIERYKGR